MSATEQPGYKKCSTVLHKPYNIGKM